MNRHVALIAALAIALLATVSNGLNSAALARGGSGGGHSGSRIGVSAGHAQGSYVHPQNDGYHYHQGYPRYYRYWQNGRWYWYPYYDPCYDDGDCHKQPPPPPPPVYVYKSGKVVSNYGWVKQADGTMKWGEINSQYSSPGAKPEKVE